MSIILYHNSRCSKSRATLALLNKNGIKPLIVNYLDTPPSKDDLQKINEKLNTPITDMIRFKEPLAKELSIGKEDNRTTAQWIEILHENPKLIERPIVVKGDKAVIGRPPENVLSLI